MDDIALQLAMSKKTLYKWFENKDELVQAVIRLHLQANECGCEETTKAATNAVEELFRIMTLNKKLFSQLHPSVFYDLQKYHPGAWNLFNAHKMNFILATVKANIRRGMEEGLFRADLDVEVMSRLRLAQIELVFNPNIFPPDQFNVGEVQLKCLEHFMLGIATLKGHKLINEYKQVTEEE
ncbi:TetR family transcriptional regulator [Adhaeribacter aerolatus]|uniref:TetR family transcriptional regulator n=2 Tax=Adhaeribacter aerolatus TaxID=670289 RepID=A0A512AZZ6_9BACT|nr:TetR family transcriptional regulator [Adhaeribacter aerolatus]